MFCMKQYPSISKKIIKGQPCYTFDKLDGSNIRVEWTKKSGFNKWGSRKRLLGTDQDIISKSPDIFHRDFEGIEEIFKKNKWEKVTLFFEFYGDNSFAGTHDPNDNHKLYLIDVNPYKKGILPPKEFIKMFSDYNCAEYLFHGNITRDIELSIRKSSFEGVTSEGVVCKFITKKGQWSSFKIKSNNWLERLKKKCGDDDKMFERLS